MIFFAVLLRGGRDDFSGADHAVLDIRSSRDRDQHLTQFECDPAMTGSVALDLSVDFFHVEVRQNNPEAAVEVLAGAGLVAGSATAHVEHVHSVLEGELGERREVDLLPVVCDQHDPRSKP